jgi:hypothetical protein
MVRHHDHVADVRGPRVQESGLGLIPGHACSAPYEDVKLKAK